MCANVDLETNKLKFPEILFCKEFLWTIWWVCMCLLFTFKFVNSDIDIEFFSFIIILCAFVTMYSQFKLYDRWG